MQGAWLWPVKDYIDRKFMSMYSSGLDQMAEQMARTGKPAAASEPAVATAAGPEALAAISAAKMRCGGCGGKVTVLSYTAFTAHPTFQPRADVVSRAYCMTLPVFLVFLQVSG